MSRLDELPPDQSAALSLLLRQRKSYAEVALLLGIAERAVHDRAHAALTVLAPRQARELAPERRAEIADYLLGQAGVAERLRTRTYLAGSEDARAWAQALVAELAPVAGGELPEIPAPASAPL
ncbi:MAG: sigma factor-like helix-turn-helix DNA-binding protein, partial [Solirubrobacteraceae bacterium]